MGFTDERLWEVLEAKAKEEDKKTAGGYLEAVKKICNFGIERAITIRDTFPLYTLHDEEHITNVLNITQKLLGEEGLNGLTRDEAAMLLMSACCHDIGMSYSKEEKEELLEPTNSRLNEYLDSNKTVSLKAYPDGKDKPPVLTDDMKTNYLRSIHHERTYALLASCKLPRDMQIILDVEVLSDICKSHGENIRAFDPEKKREDFDPVFCAIILRLADILDFDASRAPLAVYEYCAFERRDDLSSKISQGEWEKHLSSGGFNFQSIKDRSRPYKLYYKAVCDSMQTERAINDYLDWVDKEFGNCQYCLYRVNDRWRGFILPAEINRDIRAIGYVSGEYRLSLDQDKVLELLAGNGLYNDPAVFVRELLQNAIDAVRTRDALTKNRTDDWKPRINIRCWMDNEGYHWFRIEDNGTGMDKDIILNYFLKAGRSYYTSDDFNHAKLESNADPDYMPISRFGIGILSCFMDGDGKNIVEVSTKKNERGSRGLRLRMEGMSGYYYMAEEDRSREPKPMIGVTKEEQFPYLKNPGTAVAVRTNLFKSGKYRGFKEVVDKYLLFPPVPVHYDGPDGSFDYPTEQEFMDDMHSINPSEDREKDGVLEIPLTDEQIREIQRNNPELVFESRPRVVIKCFALDRYTESPYLSGVVFKVDLVPTPKRYIPRDTRREFVNMHVSLHGGELYIDYRNSLYKSMRLFDFKEHPWFTKYFKNRKTNVIHNGIICVDVNSYTDKELRDSDFDIGFLSIILLKDNYRPIVNISRNGIEKLNLETSVGLSLTMDRIAREVCIRRDFLNNKSDISPRFIPNNTFIYLQNKHPDFEKYLWVNTNRGIFTVDELDDKLTEYGSLRILGRADYIRNDILYFLSIAWLKQNFTLKVKLDRIYDEILLFPKEKWPAINQNDYFPAFLFLEPYETECKYLTSKFGTSCNIKHRFSIWILNNSDLLRKHAEGILNEIIYILIDEYGDELCQKINALLIQLRSHPLGVFQVPDEIFLTEADLC